MNSPVWTERNLWIREFIPPNRSVIDWGCGDKDILRYISPSEYLGIDQNPLADLQADFNTSIPQISEKYDLGLVLGVLEYLENPESFLKNIKSTANQFLILCLVDRKKKVEWTNSFNSDDFETLLDKIWKNVSIKRNKNYLLAICSD